QHLVPRRARVAGAEDRLPNVVVEDLGVDRAKKPGALWPFCLWSVTCGHARLSSLARPPVAEDHHHTEGQGKGAEYKNQFCRFDRHLAKEDVIWVKADEQ